MMSDIEILEMKLGGILVKEMTAITFFGWLAGKLNNVPITNIPALNELRMAVATPPMMPRLADESKIKYIRKLMDLGIAI